MKQLRILEATLIITIGVLLMASAPNFHLYYERLIYMILAFGVFFSGMIFLRAINSKVKNGK